MNKSASNIPPASTRAVRSLAPLLTIASMVGMANIPDRQLATSCLFAAVVYLFTTLYVVFDNFDATDQESAAGE